jgi:hypothetical protein
MGTPVGNIHQHSNSPLNYSSSPVNHSRVVQVISPTRDDSLTKESPLEGYSNNYGHPGPNLYYQQPQQSNFNPPKFASIPYSSPPFQIPRGAQLVASPRGRNDGSESSQYFTPSREEMVNQNK